THGFNWIPTRQPVVKRHWPALPRGSDVFSTLGKWEHAAERRVQFAGQTYESSKARQWWKLLDLPTRTSWKLRMAMADVPTEAQRQFESHGWGFDDPAQASRDPAAFQRYVANCAGELTVAKEIYTALPSGWFSDRSACFLMSGRPVITQASGFDQWLPTGEGLFSFQTVDEAAGALEAIRSDYGLHSRRARQIAEENFESAKVLKDLLDRVA
ncbi:MAG: hypothetical protein NZ561_07170, partial [Phycisphaerae bacterium]|nr:hypothetical protein [Phycisphaerae bacterium]MDW8263333.1 hypothetical protein [Phycisphaerales bacterium]